MNINAYNMFVGPYLTQAMQSLCLGLTAAFLSHLIFQEDGFFFKASTDVDVESGLADPE